MTTRFHADNLLGSARALLRAEGVEAEFHEIADDPTDALLDTAAAHEADLIVVGSRGEGAVKRALHGSVSTKVLHHAPCSVLVVRARGDHRADAGSGATVGSSRVCGRRGDRSGV